MDCDGLKKALLMDTDGTLLGQAGSAISQANYLWGKNITINNLFELIPKQSDFLF